MNPIIDALRSGYSPKKILQYLSRSDSELASKISQALAAGYTAEKVLAFLHRGGNDLSKGLPPQGNEQDNYYIRQIGSKHPDQAETFGNIAKIAGAAVVTPFALEALGARSAGASAIPGQPQATPGAQVAEALQAPMTPTQAPPTPAAPEASITPAQPVPQAPTQAMSLVDELVSTVDMASLPPTRQDQLNFLRMALEKLEKEGKGRDDPAVQRIFAKAKDLASKKPNVLDETITKFEQGYREDTAIKQEEIEAQKPQGLARGATVITPNGLTEIVDVAKKSMLVKDGNRIVQVPKNQAIELPAPEKDLADLYSDLIGGIEKSTNQDVSRNVYFSGYDPETRELLYIPHGGGAYIYDDIDESTAKELTELMSTRKTTGKNYIGAWEEGTESPIGARMSELILKLQKDRGGKGKEYRNKFGTIYDAIEPAKEALKEKKKAEAQAKREAEKKVKQELKEKLKSEKERNKKTKKPRPG